MHVHTCLQCVCVRARACVRVGTPFSMAPEVRAPARVRKPAGPQAFLRLLEFRISNTRCAAAHDASWVVWAGAGAGVRWWMMQKDVGRGALPRGGV